MINLNDKKEREQALANFVDLLKHPGWNLVKEIVEANIEVVKEQILMGLENETKESIDRLRDKLKVYRDVISTPEKMIDSLKPVEPAQYDENDPFPVVEMDGVSPK